MTVEELKMEHLDRYPESTFFDESWLTVMGIDMKESRVTGPIQINTKQGLRECYVLTETRHKAPPTVKDNETCFDAETFQVVVV